MNISKSVSTTHIGSLEKIPRKELRDVLGLTGCEMSLSTITAGTAIPFVHSHKENEEVYLILSGSGQFWLSGEVYPLKAGDVFRINPEVERCLRASGTEDLTYLCVQAKVGATPNFTRTDGVIVSTDPVWIDD